MYTIFIYIPCKSMITIPTKVNFMAQNAIMNVISRASPATTDFLEMQGTHPQDSCHLRQVFDAGDVQGSSGDQHHNHGQIPGGLKNCFLLVGGWQ